MKQTWHYGIIVGLLVTVWEIFMISMGSYNNPSDKLAALDLFGLIWIIAGIGLGLRTLKRANHNDMSFPQAFIGGLNIAFLAGLVQGLLLWFYFTDFNPEVVESLIDKSIDNTLDADRVKIVLLVQNFMATVVVGILSSLVGAFVFRSSAKTIK